MNHNKEGRGLKREGVGGGIDFVPLKRESLIEKEGSFQRGWA